AQFARDDAPWADPAYRQRRNTLCGSADTIRTGASVRILLPDALYRIFDGRLPRVSRHTEHGSRGDTVFSLPRRLWVGGRNVGYRGVVCVLPYCTPAIYRMGNTLSLAWSSYCGHHTTKGRLGRDQSTAKLRGDGGRRRHLRRAGLVFTRELFHQLNHRWANHGGRIWAWPSITGWSGPCARNVHSSAGRRSPCPNHGHGRLRQSSRGPLLLFPFLCRLDTGNRQ